MATPEETAAAEAYEDLYVEGLFAEWAPRVADAAAVSTGASVLDVACGTGVLARELARRVGPTGRVAGLDPAPGMLAVAEATTPGVEWHGGAAEDLPFEDGTFDAVVSQFGLMFFADRRGALGEMVRVLRPGGKLGIAVWGSLDTNPAYAAAVDLLERQAGAAAADALRAPFVLGDVAQLADLFASAGLDVRIETVAGRGVFPSIRTMVEADLRGWLPLMGVPLSEERIEAILSEAEQVLAEFRLADESVEFLSTAHVAGATKP